MLFVLLGKAVSEAYWTQAWIGYEVGIFKALADIDPAPKHVIVLQDIRQGIKVCVPTLKSLFLFDFSCKSGWYLYKELVIVLGKLEPFFIAASSFRSATIMADVKCEHCKSGYETWIASCDRGELGERLSQCKSGSELICKCTIECPSCKEMFTRCFKSMYSPSS